MKENVKIEINFSKATKALEDLILAIDLIQNKKGVKEIKLYYFTNWAKHSIKSFLKIWFFYWSTDHLEGLWTEFQIRFLGFSIRFREYKRG